MFGTRETVLKMIVDSHAALGKIWSAKKILFGFGSQVTRGEGFIKKHPARPGDSRSLLNNLWDFCRKYFVKNFDK